MIFVVLCRILEGQRRTESNTQKGGRVPTLQRVHLLLSTFVVDGRSSGMEASNCDLGDQRHPGFC